MRSLATSRSWMVRILEIALACIPKSSINFSLPSNLRPAWKTRDLSRNRCSNPPSTYATRLPQQCCLKKHCGKAWYKSTSENWIQGSCNSRESEKGVFGMREPSFPVFLHQFPITRKKTADKYLRLTSLTLASFLSPSISLVQLLPSHSHCTICFWKFSRLVEKISSWKVHPLLFQWHCVSSKSLIGFLTNFNRGVSE